MENYLYLLGYLPAMAATYFLAAHFFKEKSYRRKEPQKETEVKQETAEQKQPTEYSLEYKPRSGEESARLLSDDGADSDEYDDLKDRLVNLLESEKIFLDPNIRISEVAARLLTNKTSLSRAIRLKTGRNFCQLVHYYRVREAMRLYTENPSLTISQLCKMVGFNSMTTFNTAFGRNTGFTPAEWCKNYRKQTVRTKALRRA